MPLHTPIEGEQLLELIQDADAADDPEQAIEDAITLWLELENPREMIDLDESQL